MTLLSVSVKCGYDTVAEIEDNSIAAQVLLLIAQREPRLVPAESLQLAKVRAEDELNKKNQEWAQEYTAHQKAKKELEDLRKKLAALQGQETPL